MILGEIDSAWMAAFRPAKGAIAGDVVWPYGYDPRNQRVKAVRKSNGTDIDLRVEYKYDAWGSRVQKSVDADGDGSGPADLTKFVLDGWNPAKSAPIGLENFDVLADLDADGSLKTRYLRGDLVDQILARIDATGDHPGSYWYLTDHQGSVKKILDHLGATKTALTYDAYGNILTETDPEYRGRYTWTGRETEVEIEMQFNRARFYDPTTGRWISKDPMGFGAGDSNLYRYANNRSWMAIDPSGLLGVDVVATPDKVSQQPGPARTYFSLSRNWKFDQDVTGFVVQKVKLTRHTSINRLFWFDFGWTHDDDRASAHKSTSQLQPMSYGIDGVILPIPQPDTVKCVTILRALALMMMKGHWNVKKWK